MPLASSSRHKPAKVKKRVPRNPETSVPPRNHIIMPHSVAIATGQKDERKAATRGQSCATVDPQGEQNDEMVPSSWCNRIILPRYKECEWWPLGEEKRSHLPSRADGKPRPSERIRSNPYFCSFSLAVLCGTGTRGERSRTYQIRIKTPTSHGKIVVAVVDIARAALVGEFLLKSSL